MKIALLIPSLDAAGPDRVFSLLAQGFAEAGHQALVVTNVPGGRYWESLPDSVDARSLHPAREQQLRQGYPVRRLERLLSREQPDIILTTLGMIYTAAAASRSPRVRGALVMRPANHVTQSARRLYRARPVKHGISWAATVGALACAKHVVCQSEDLKNDLRKYGFRDRSMTIIGNPVQINDLPRAKLSDKTGKVELLAVGRLDAQKGFDVLIEAMGLLRAQGLRDIRLRIAGEGGAREALTRQIERSALAGSVQLLGFRDDVTQLVGSADVLVSSSRYEGFPNVVLESLSMGVPVVATNCPGGTRALVEHGKNGWLCRPGDPTALAAQISYAVEEHRLLQASQISASVERKFSLHSVVGSYVQLFAGLQAVRS